MVGEEKGFLREEERPLGGGPAGRKAFKRLLFYSNGTRDPTEAIHRLGRRSVADIYPHFDSLYYTSSSQHFL